MAKRVLKQHDERKNELLDAAQALFVERGFDATPVSAIIDAVGVAKGTFYHYFDSKDDLLDALVVRITDQIFERVQAAIAGEGRDAVTRLKAFFAASSRWKAANREALMAIVKPLYAEQNITLRNKMIQHSASHGIPILVDIIRQGIQEGVMDTKYPEESAEILIYMGFALGHGNFLLLADMESKPENWEALMHRLRAYEASFERILGLAEGTLQILDNASVEAFRPTANKNGRTAGGS